MISAGKATLHELQSLYSTEDAHLLMDIISVDAHNRAVAHKWFNRNT